MGDRCYMEWHCRKDDVHKFDEVRGEYAEFEEEERTALIREEEANYALSIPDGWPTNIPYYGFHTDGAEYSGEEFACDGKELVVVDCVNGGGPCVQAGPRGVSKADLDRVKKYYRVLARAKKALEKK